MVGALLGCLVRVVRVLFDLCDYYFFCVLGLEWLVVIGYCCAW